MKLDDSVRILTEHFGEDFHKFQTGTTKAERVSFRKQLFELLRNHAIASLRDPDEKREDGLEQELSLKENIAALLERFTKDRRTQALAESCKKVSGQHLPGALSGTIFEFSDKKLSNSEVDSKLNLILLVASRSSAVLTLITAE